MVFSVALLLALGMAGSREAAADTGQDLFHARCAGCHGKNAEGKSKTHAPSLKSDKVRSMSDDDLRKIISQRANGEMEKKSSHTLLKKHLDAEQVDAIISYIRGMQSK